MGLAHFYHYPVVVGGFWTKLHSKVVATTVATTATNNVGAPQGATVMTSDVEERRVSFGLGYQVVTFDKSSSGFGHSGVGGSIGLYITPRAAFQLDS
jgi:hypothetical protein